MKHFARMFPLACRVLVAASTLVASSAFVAAAQSPSALTADKFSDSVFFTLHDGPPVRVTRARAMILTASYWADAYAQLGMYMRANNRVPPEVCRRGAIMWNLNFGCDSGYPRCFDTKGGMELSGARRYANSHRASKGICEVP